MKGTLDPSGGARWPGSLHRASRRAVFWVTAVILWSTSMGEASAAGFSVGHQGAGAEGVAGAATARTDLPEVAWYNPAAVQPGFAASIGTSVLFPTLQHTAEDGTQTKSENPPSTPPWLHLSYLHRFGRHRAGLAIVGNVPYGSGVQWPESWAGRFEATSVALQVFEVSAAAVYGVEVADDVEVAVSGGYRQMFGTFELGRRVDAVDSEGSVQLAGDATAAGFLVALHGRYRPFSLGMNYRSGASLGIDGTAHFEEIPVELSGAAHDQAFATTLPLASRLAAGVAYDLGFGTASVDVEAMNWSRFETLEIDFEDDETPDVSQRRDYTNTVGVRAGYEHRPVDELAVRAGGSWDPSPAPASAAGPTVPDSSRVGVSVGAGYRVGFGLGIDLAFTHVQFVGVDSTNSESLPGKYDGRIEVVSVGVSYR